MKKNNIVSFLNDCSFYKDISKQELDDLIKVTLSTIVDGLTGDMVYYESSKKDFNKVQFTEALVHCDKYNYVVSIAISNKVLSSICDCMLGGSGEDPTELINSDEILGVNEFFNLIIESLFLNISDLTINDVGISQSFDDIVKSEVFTDSKSTNIQFKFKSTFGIIRIKIDTTK